MQERLINIVEGMLVFTTMGSFILAAYVIITMNNIPN